MYFILVDAYTKSPEIYVVKNITSETVIKKCKEIFSQFGLPSTFLSENGRIYVSEKFKNFLKEQAERYVQIMKNFL